MRIKVDGTKLERGKIYWMKVNAWSRSHPLIGHDPIHRQLCQYEGPVKFIKYEDRESWDNGNFYAIFPIKVKGLTYNPTVNRGGIWADDITKNKAYLFQEDFKAYEIEEQCKT
jgi:hypothetical protein